MGERSLTVGSLFSGVGGLELGLELAGLGPVLWQVEKEPFCREVLAKHWPTVARFHDVCTVGAHDLPAVDLLCGGFPCQDLSLAGKGAGLAGARSGLWFEYARIIGELRPRFVVVENVAALVNRGLHAVLGSLASLRYDAWWDCIPAAAVGAPHRRDRLFVVAWRVADAGSAGAAVQPGRRSGADRPNQALALGHGAHGDLAAAGAAGDVADPDRDRQLEPEGRVNGEWRWALDGGQELAHAASGGLRRRDGANAPGLAAGGDCARSSESGLGRAASGLPRWLDGHWPARPGEAQHPWEAPRTAQGVEQRAARLRSLGNAVSPAVGYAVGLIVRELERTQRGSNGH